MEPIKFEKHIKSKLDTREIQPSADAWDTLERRLNENEKTKSKKGYWWLAIAAGFIGIFFVLSMFMNSNETENNNPVIVDTESIDENDPAINIVETEIQTVERTGLDKVDTPKLNTAEEKETNSKERIVNTIPKVQPKIVEEVLVQNKTKEQKTLALDTSTVKSAITFEEQKVLDVVNQIKALEKNNSSVSEKEINALLRAAQKEIALNKIYDESSNSVNAEALLQDVENDLNESFRNRVFKVLRFSYENVKTAVAERNN